MLRYISNELAEDIVYPGSTRNTPLKPNARAGSDASGINVYLMNKVLRPSHWLRGYYIACGYQRLPDE